MPAKGEQPAKEEPPLTSAQQAVLNWLKEAKLDKAATTFFEHPTGQTIQAISDATPEAFNELIEECKRAKTLKGPQAKKLNAHRAKLQV